MASLRAERTRKIITTLERVKIKKIKILINYNWCTSPDNFEFILIFVAGGTWRSIALLLTKEEKPREE